jgi:hypothetical protein
MTPKALLVNAVDPALALLGGGSASSPTRARGCW